jgi:hypothetical protein
MKVNKNKCEIVLVCMSKDISNNEEKKNRII